MYIYVYVCVCTYIRNRVAVVKRNASATLVYGTYRISLIKYNCEYIKPFGANGDAYLSVSYCIYVRTYVLRGWISVVKEKGTNIKTLGCYKTKRDRILKLTLQYHLLLYLLLRLLASSLMYPLSTINV